MCERILQFSRSSSHALSSHRGGCRLYGGCYTSHAGVAKPFVIELLFMLSGEGGVVVCATGALIWDDFHTRASLLSAAKNS